MKKLIFIILLSLSLALNNSIISQNNTNLTNNLTNPAATQLAPIQPVQSQVAPVQPIQVQAQNPALAKEAEIGQNLAPVAPAQKQSLTPINPAQIQSPNLNTSQLQGQNPVQNLALVKPELGQNLMQAKIGENLTQVNPMPLGQQIPAQNLPIANPTLKDQNAAQNLTPVAPSQNQAQNLTPLTNSALAPNINQAQSAAQIPAQNQIEQAKPVLSQANVQMPNAQAAQAQAPVTNIQNNLAGTAEVNANQDFQNSSGKKQVKITGKKIKPKDEFTESKEQFLSWKIKNNAPNLTPNLRNILSDDKKIDFWVRSLRKILDEPIGTKLTRNSIVNTVNNLIKVFKKEFNLELNNKDTRKLKEFIIQLVIPEITLVDIDLKQPDAYGKFMYMLSKKHASNDKDLYALALEYLSYQSLFVALPIVKKEIPEKKRFYLMHQVQQDDMISRAADIVTEDFLKYAQIWKDKFDIVLPEDLSTIIRNKISLFLKLKFRPF